MSNLSQLRICTIRQPPKKSTPSDKPAAAFMTNVVWSNESVITVAFQSPQYQTSPFQSQSQTGQNMDPLQQLFDDAEKNNTLSREDLVKLIFKERFEPIVNMTFKFLDTPWDVNNGTSEPAVIRISFNGDDGAWSVLGNQALDVPPNEPTMNLGWMDAGTTIHEIGHMCGMIHEHQNPKKGIQWNEEKVYRWAEETQHWDKRTTFTNIIQKTDKTTINGSEYDPNSIMLYFFPPELTTDGIGTHQNLQFSVVDTFWLQKTYPPTLQRSLEDPIQFLTSIYGNEFVKKQLGESPPIGGSQQKINTSKLMYITLLILAIIGVVIFIII